MPYDYHINVIHRDKNGMPKAQHLGINGPHDLQLVLLTGRVTAQLEHLAPDPGNPDQVRLQLTFTDKELNQ